MNMPNLVTSARQWCARLSPRRRQYAALGAILAGGIGALWGVLAFTGPGAALAPAPARSPGNAVPTNIAVMAPGQQVNSVDQWVGTAGRKLAQYEHERDEQERLNRERKDFEARTMARFGALEQQLAGGGKIPEPAAVAPAPSMPVAPASPAGFPPASALPPNLPAPGRALPPLPPSAVGPERSEPPAPGLVHVAIANAARPVPVPVADASTTTGRRADTVGTFLPVSFTRGVLLGGLDAPTGGQSQSNPHPILIRLLDNTVLPNRFRAAYRDCFVIAAGYGDIGSERAYLRTESLSCVRDDGTTLEVNLQGSVYGEDGKVGMRGRLVTKQGQLLANALLAGVASGLGQGLASASTTVSTTPLGSMAMASGIDATRAGVGNGVGRALDRLAQYYIKLAEQTFPVIEIDAGREVDVVITKGVRIDAPPASRAAPDTAARRAAMETHPLKGENDEQD